MSGDDVHITRGEVRRMLNDQREALNKALAALQQDMHSMQTKLNAAWNGMNAVLRGFLDRGLITEQDIVDAGQKLMAEARENMERLKAANSIGQHRPAVGYIETPLESFQRDIGKKTVEKKEN